MFEVLEETLLPWTQGVEACGRPIIYPDMTKDGTSVEQFRGFIQGLDRNAGTADGSAYAKSQMHEAERTNDQVADVARQPFVWFCERVVWDDCPGFD